MEGYDERAFISMNEQKVIRLEIDNGSNNEVIDIDCNKPFAIVVLVNEGSITFFDEKGQIVDYYSQML